MPVASDETRRVRSGRVGLEDVARRAGVGIATVDRVLNERGSVAPATARRVIDAARELGLKRVLPRPYRRALRFEVLLARAETRFVERLNRGFMTYAATLDRAVVVQRTLLPEVTPEQLAQRIRAATADGLMIYGEDHPVVRDAIAAVTEQGVAVVSLVTDMPGSARVAYVGIDNARAGRTAGFLVGRLVRGAGAAVVVTKLLAYRAHADRLAGFRDGLARAAPQIPIAAVLEGRDEPDRAARLLGRALNDSSIVAVYNSAGVNSAVAGVIRRKRRPGELVLVGHELMPETAELLREGLMTVTIDQAPEQQAQRAIRVLLHHFGQLDAPPEPSEVPFTLHTRENAM